MRATRHAISTQKDALGPAFATPTPPKLTPSRNAVGRPKRSSGFDLPHPVLSKRGRRPSTQFLTNGETIKVQHKRKPSNDKAFAALSDGHDFFSPTKSPRFKVKYRIPEPLITHPLHLPLPKQFGSLNAYLDSYIQLEDNEDTTLEKAEAKAFHEAAIQDRITLARQKGWLEDSVNPAAPRKQPEPPNVQTRHDVMLKHVLNFSGLMAQERRGNISRAKKIALMIQQHFKKLEGTDEKEMKAEEKRIRRLAKTTAQEVRKKWKLAEKVFSNSE